jgi:hypothetical protein
MFSKSHGGATRIRASTEARKFASSAQDTVWQALREVTGEKSGNYRVVLSNAPQPPQEEDTKATDCSYLILQKRSLITGGWKATGIIAVRSHAETPHRHRLTAEIRMNRPGIAVRKSPPRPLFAIVYTDQPHSIPHFGGKNLHTEIARVLRKNAGDVIRL